MTGGVGVAARGLHVESAGRGPPLVLLHGFALHGGLFAPLLPRLASTHRVHVVDLPGHGHSPPLAHYTLDGVADAVDAAVGAVAGLQPPVVLGWSFGGQVALAWARRRPQRVARLMLVCTTPSFVTRDDWRCAMDPSTLARFGDELRVAYRLTLQRFLTLQVQGSERGRATLGALRARLFERGTPSPDSVAATLALLQAIDLRAAASAIGVPALVVSGSRDTLAPAAAGEWLAAALPDARYLAIPGAAHAPFLSHPPAFDAAVADFLDAR
jgi:pimeloyl-[acyl-carrier protein] methyl ester esterase